MQGVIRFNDKKQRFEGFFGQTSKQIIARGQKKDFVERKLKEKGAVSVIFDDVQATLSQESVKFACNDVNFSINERFDFLEQFVRMVASKKANSLVISGPGGLGKTHTVLETLKAAGLKEDTIGSHKSDFVVIKGFTTAKGLYRTLFENNGKVIIFDDADSSFKDPIGANVLKGALDSQERRVISWNAEFSDREDLPNRFEFHGRVIFISNLEMTKIPQALISRSLRVSLDMNTAEKVERIETVMMQNNFMTHVDMKIKQEVFEFIKKHSSQFSDLNIRTAMNITQVRDGVEDAAMFERMALYMARS